MCYDVYNVAMGTARLCWQKRPPIRIGSPGTAEEWLSTCGSYRIWVQARVREGVTYIREYAAQFMDEKPWLAHRADFMESKEICQAHADGRPRPTVTSTKPPKGSPRRGRHATKRA